jgi:Mrp family chromosome partitioning ATPase
MAELNQSFDHVLIDSPALNRSADALSLGRLVDGMLLVLQSNATRRETARTVIANIRNASVNLLGAVLNKRTFPIPQNLYDRL